MADKEKNIELRSEEIQDILGKVPPWMIRKGMMGISLVIIILLVVAALFKYPDRIRSQIQVTTDHPPVYMVARTTAKINEFLVEKDQQVNPGDLLVVLESSADYHDVLKARELVDGITIGPDNIDTDYLSEIAELKNLELGNIQGDFAALQKSIQTLLDYLEFDKYSIRIKNLEKELSNQVDQSGRLWDQRKNRDKELEIATTQYNRKLGLNRNGTISDLDLEEAEKNYYSKKGLLDDARIAMSESKGVELQLEKSLIELNIQKQEEEKNSYALIKENSDKFLGAIADWEQMYLMVSPIQGKVSLSAYYAINQEVKEGDRVLTIVQEEDGPILGKVKLPNLGAGKVKEGQKVIIRFDRYPHMEFGLVSGVISSISPVPEEASYHVEVTFPDGLKTSYDQELEFAQEMTGQADIITENRSFLVRIISPLKSMLRRNAIGDQ